MGHKIARAPTRSPQGGRARQNAAKNHADLHAESRPRRESGRGGGERAPASEFHPQPRTAARKAAPAKAAHRRASGGAVAASGGGHSRATRSGAR